MLEQINTTFAFFFDTDIKQDRNKSSYVAFGTKGQLATDPESLIGDDLKSRRWMLEVHSTLEPVLVLVLPDRHLGSGRALISVEATLILGRRMLVSANETATMLKTEFRKH